MLAAGTRASPTDSAFGCARGSKAVVSSWISLLLSEDEWEAVLAASDHDNFCIRALGQVFSCLDAFPLKDRWRDALSYNLLEVAQAGGLDAFALCFLRFFLQAEVHGQCFLLCLLLGFDRGFQGRRQLDIAQEDGLHRQAALAELRAYLILNLLSDEFALA